ncbi:MAG TPA: amidase family protein, partial [Burkholderiales bacterium]|nr:amidase family protein [Burkholderiales bacterium]
ARMRRRLHELLEGYDVLLAPSASGEAPLGLGATGDASMCVIWTTAHVPAVTLPLFTGPAGLPVGAQLVARRNHDRALLEAARWVLRHLR